MGEHAVVYGAPALVTAVELRAEARAEVAEAVPSGSVLVSLPDLDHRDVLREGEVRGYARGARRRWEEFRRSPSRESFEGVRGEGPDHVTLVALGEAMEAADAGDGDGTGGAGVRVTVRSRIPVGRGFGSSAAVGAAVALAWLAREEVELPPEALEALLLDVERRQHGQPSGVDTACVLRGGLIGAVPSGEGGMRIEQLPVRSDLLDRFRLVDTGAPAESTGEVVAAVRERRDDDPESVEAALRRMSDTTSSFRRLLDAGSPDPERVVDLVRRCQRGLEEIGVVPEPVRRLVRAVEEEGGAAKISGAGALTSPAGGPPGGGLLLVYHPDPGRIPQWSFLRDLEVLEVRLGAEGARVEARP